MAPRKGMREGCLPSPDWPPTTPNHAHDGWTITTTHRNRAQHIVEALGRREVRQGPSNVRRLLDTQPRDVRAASADWADNTIGETARRAAAAPAAVLAALVTRRQWWSRPVRPPSADRPAWFRPRHDPGNWRSRPGPSLPWPRACRRLSGECLDPAPRSGAWAGVGAAQVRPGPAGVQAITSWASSSWCTRWMPRYLLARVHLPPTDLYRR